MSVRILERLTKENSPYMTPLYGIPGGRISKAMERANCIANHALNRVSCGTGIRVHNDPAHPEDNTVY